MVADRDLRQPPSQLHPKMLLSLWRLTKYVNWSRLPILYIPLAITAIRRATCAIETHAADVAGATNSICYWALGIERAIGSHRCTLRKHDDAIIRIPWEQSWNVLTKIQRMLLGLRWERRISSSLGWWRLLKCDVLGRTAFDRIQWSARGPPFKAFNGCI